MTKKQVKTRALKDLESIAVNGKLDDLKNAAYYVGVNAYIVKMRAAKKVDEKEFLRIRGEFNAWTSQFIREWKRKKSA
jgi:hypothetical protein